MAWKRYIGNRNWQSAIYLRRLSITCIDKIRVVRQRLKSHIILHVIELFSKNRKFDILKKDIDRNTVYKYWKYCHRQIPIKIYSYWNVNSSLSFPPKRPAPIKIYSYWNVNNSGIWSFHLIKSLKSTHIEM